MPDTSLVAPAAQVSVLVVDDKKDVADSLAQFLRAAGEHRVRVAYDGARAVRMATADVPDVVVCDIAMPGLPGLRVAESLSQLDPARSSSPSPPSAACAQRRPPARPGSTTS